MAAIASSSYDLEIFIEKRLKQLEKDRLEIPNLHAQQYLLETKLATMTQRHQYHQKIQTKQKIEKFKDRIIELESPNYTLDFQKIAQPYRIAAEQERLTNTMQQYVQNNLCNPEITFGTSNAFGQSINVSQVPLASFTPGSSSFSTITCLSSVKPVISEQVDLFKFQIILNSQYGRILNNKPKTNNVFDVTQTLGSSKIVSNSFIRPSSEEEPNGPVEKKKRGRKRLCDKQVFSNVNSKKPRYSLNGFFEKPLTSTTIVKLEPTEELYDTDTEVPIKIKVESEPIYDTSVPIVKFAFTFLDTQIPNDTKMDTLLSLPTCNKLKIVTCTPSINSLKDNKKKRKMDSLAFDHFLMDVEHIPNSVQIVDEDVCINPKCNQRPMVRMTETSLLTCEGCGYCKTYLDATSTSGSIGNPTQTTKYYEGTHYAEWLILFENLESYVIHDETMREIIENLYSRGFKTVGDITVVAIRETMKILGLNKLYQNTTQVYCRLTGRAPPRLTTSQREIGRKMFEAIQVPWLAKYKPPTRKNAMSYSYQFWKICQSCEWNHFFEFIVLLSGVDKVEKHETWMRNCYNDLLQSTSDPRWIFVPIDKNIIRRNASKSNADINRQLRLKHNLEKLKRPNEDSQISKKTKI